MKIMIVDDHADMRRVLKNVVLLTITEPIEFTECDSGEEAVEQYMIHGHDCVLMDLQMDNMNGFEATKQMQKHDKDANVIIVTSFDTPSFRKKAKELNTYGFVCKDSLSELHQLLHNITTK